MDRRFTRSRTNPHLEITTPTLLREADLAEMHDPHYVEAVRTGKPLALAEFRLSLGSWSLDHGLRAHQRDGRGRKACR